MWIKLSRFILRYRIALLVSLILLTGLMAYQASKVELEYTYAVVLPETDSSFKAYTEFKKTFGEENNLLVMGVQDEKFFTVEKINDWNSLIDSLQRIEGVDSVLSVTQAIALDKDTTARRFKVRKIFAHHYTTQAEVDSAVKEFKSIPIYNNLIYNDTSHVYMLAATIAKEKINSKERIKLVDSIETYTRHFGEKHQVEFHYSGLPYTRTRIAEMIKKELNMFVALAMLITAIILYIFFRSFKVTLFSLTIVGIAVIWSLATLVILGYKITILTGLIPPLLIVIGIPNCVFLINKYQMEYKNHGNKIKALQRTIHKTGNATFLTNLTTACGFATFIVTNNRILKEFGLVASINIMAIFIVSLVLIPIIFSFVKPPTEKYTRHLESAFTRKVIKGFTWLVINHRPKIYITAAVLFVAGIFGVTKLKSTGYIVDDIPASSPIYQDLKFFEKHFGGVMPLEITIDTHKKNLATKLHNLKKIDALQDSLARHKDIGKPLSIADGLKYLRQAYYNGNPTYYAIPGELEFGLNDYLQNSKTENGLLKGVVDSTGQIARISLRVKDIGSVEMEKLHQDLRKEANAVFPASKYDVSVTGASIIYTRGNSYLINNMFTSILLAIGLISLILASMFTWWKMVIVSLIPNFLPIVFTAALMGFTGIPLKPSTVLIFSISFGIAVDGAIHFLAKYRQDLLHTNGDIGKSVIHALKEAGVSMVYTIIILFFGFGIFTLSRFGGTQALGMLISITLLVAMMSNLILLPSFLLTLEKNIRKKAFHEPLMQTFDEEDDIDYDELRIPEDEPPISPIDKTGETY